jgi:hypothetical protein
MRIHTAISMILLACSTQMSVAGDTNPERLCLKVQNQIELDAAFHKNKGHTNVVYARADWAIAGKEIDAYFPSEQLKSIIGKMQCIIADVTKSGGDDIQAKYNMRGIPFVLLIDDTNHVIAKLTGPRTFIEFKAWLQSPDPVLQEQDAPSNGNAVPMTQSDDTVEGLRKLSKEGNREAQFLLGAMGLNSSIPIDESIHWLTQASSQGCTGATGILGSIYLSEDHNMKDDAKGIPLIKIAADQGDWGSQTSLSGLLYKGHPLLPRDPEASYAWAYLSHLSASNSLMGIAIKYQLAIIEPDLTKKQISIAQQWAKNKFSSQVAPTSVCMQSMAIR